MFGLGLATKVYVAVEAEEMGKGFEGLYGLVRDQLGSSERASVSIFESHAHTLESGGVGWQGLWVCAKHLEKARFCWPEVKSQQRAVTMRSKAGDAGQRARSDAG